MKLSDSSPRAKAYLDAYIGLRSQESVAVDLGVSQPAISQALTGNLSALNEEVIVKRPELSARVQEIAHLVLDRYYRELPGLSWSDMQKGSISAGIWIDKTQLLLGRPTEFILNIDLHRRDLTGLLEKAWRARRRALGMSENVLEAPDNATE